MLAEGVGLGLGLLIELHPAISAETSTILVTSSNVMHAFVLSFSI